MIPNAFSHHDQKSKLTSRGKKCILSSNRDSRDWVGQRDDGLSSSVMSSRNPPLCSAMVSVGFNFKPEATGCSSSKHHVQTWWHLEEKGTLSFLWFSLGIRRLCQETLPEKSPSYLLARNRTHAVSKWTTIIKHGITLWPVIAMLRTGRRVGLLWLVWLREGGVAI